jgi:hypothetical protein
MGVKTSRGLVEKACSKWNKLGQKSLPLFPHAFMSPNSILTYTFSSILHTMWDEILRISEHS